MIGWIVAVGLFLLALVGWLVAIRVHAVDEQRSAALIHERSVAKASLESVIREREEDVEALIQAREEIRLRDVAVRDLSAECTRLSTALNEATRLLDEREQYSVKRPRRAKVQISLESAPQEQEQME